MKRIVKLQNSIQKYTWGSRTFIPELLGEKSPAESPYAEMWMGSHPKAPSLLYNGNESRSLLELIDQNPVEILGPSVASRFHNKLPFLFKLLAASRPLSIQAHPDREQARKGFEEENRKKIPLDASNRNYRDENHKPELICALEPMWILKGFRRIEDIIRLMEKAGQSAETPGITHLVDHPDSEGLKAFFQSLMTVEKDVSGPLLKNVISRIDKRGISDPPFQWVRRLEQEYPRDMGSLSPLFLNLIRLQPAEALFIPAGELHAYLEGAGLELMANSDNVLRGGLTSKHIDMEELLGILDFSPRDPEVLFPEDMDSMESLYPVIAEEFMLSVIRLTHKESIYVSPETKSAAIMICLEGSSSVEDRGSGDILPFHRGNVLFVPASVGRYRIRGTGTIYRASVPTSRD
ncbi:MAG: mannose-6-phosphate isomerase, class I [Deltaproteobacteria bacterium]|nr:mannose-6-phosphate isomerase, class I [Deltaproteobacteria bacterium]